MHQDCLTCRRQADERQRAMVADAVNGLAALLGVALVCAVAWLLH
jgi:hypothetical protein